MGVTEDRFDVIVVGAGMGGCSAAIRAAQYGKRVALVEKSFPGGVCLNKGCIPTKTYLHMSEMYQAIQRAAELGIGVEVLAIDRGRMAAHVGEVVKRLRHGLSGLVEHAGCRLFYGTARLVGDGAVEVCSDASRCRIRGESVILATGALPVLPKISGIHSAGVFTSDDAFLEPNLVPESIVVLGGGVIGVEFASLLRGFGSKVVLVEMQDRILSDFDAGLSETICGILRRKGVQACLSGTAQSIDEADGELLVAVDSHENHQQFLADRVFIAAGRKPNYDRTELDRLGIAVEQQRIKVDRNYQTTVSGIYAIGDVASSAQLAYLASKQGEDVVEFIVNGRECPDVHGLPRCIFMDPEVAVVGESESTARNKGIPYHVGMCMAAGNGRAVLEQKSEGYVKVLLDENFQHLIGAELVCSRAVDMIPILQLAVVHRIPAEGILQCVFPHPSLSEIIRDAIAQALLKKGSE